MIMCQQCQAANPDGTVMCNQCLVPLPVPVAAGPAPMPRNLAAAGPAVQHVRWTVMENLQPIGTRLELPDLSYQGEILMGRNDLSNQVIVDVDLSLLGGLDKKVSRKHARVMFQTGQVFIEDWESAHGTYVNKKKLEKGDRQAISAGDEIRLANLIFKMEVV